ncbi:hypothetical protein GUJ93_ZPchr0002g23305 [Zizania palustris]|uniref:Uncharacterized protein n=1 Tax=Zizania palustris TaxID=103762 RepID=A0A8J5RZU2_ZIZPA|nr:hypothetical protein GUJ93_ZPchr0002g23305 [Zizania palustris]
MPASSVSDGSSPSDMSLKSIIEQLQDKMANPFAPPASSSFARSDATTCSLWSFLLHRVISEHTTPKNILVRGIVAKPAREGDT